MRSSLVIMPFSNLNSAKSYVLLEFFKRDFRCLILTRLGFYDVTARLILLMICLDILLLFTICCMIFVICYLLFFTICYLLFFICFLLLLLVFLFFVICYLIFFVISFFVCYLLVFNCYCQFSLHKFSNT